MNGTTMYDLIEYYYEDIVSDYIYPKNAKDNPEVEEVDYMEDEEFQKYAQNWVVERGRDEC
jgi:hypothetical protein